MKMLEECINKIFEKSVLVEDKEEKELLKSVYYHLLDYEDILNRVINLNNEIDNILKRWELVKKSNE